MDALIAADVMNSTNLCYVYPITRVASVENLLKNTSHSAFLVVTTEDSKKIPQRRRSISDSYIHIQLSRFGCDHQSTMDREFNELTASVREARSKTHTLPHGRKGGNIGEMPTHTNFGNFNDLGEERNHEVLTFHGIILRSQLIEMFKNKIFFNESDGVSSS